MANFMAVFAIFLSAITLSAQSREAIENRPQPRIEVSCQPEDSSSLIEFVLNYEILPRLDHSPSNLIATYGSRNHLRMEGREYALHGYDTYSPNDTRLREFFQLDGFINTLERTKYLVEQVFNSENGSGRVLVPMSDNSMTASGLPQRIALLVQYTAGGETRTLFCRDEKIRQAPYLRVISK